MVKQWRASTSFGPRQFALVFVGGSVGAGLRHALTVPSSQPYGPMLATLAINVGGAFALAVLVQVLLRLPDAGRREDLRLLLRTGLLGGFTTYSALGLHTVELLRDGQTLWAFEYGFGTLALGARATVLGGRLGQHWPRRRLGT